MAVKNISITEESYKRLASLRNRENESFSEVINRITRKNNIMDFFGALSKESGEKLEKNIENIRKIRAIADKKRIERMKNAFN